MKNQLSLRSQFLKQIQNRLKPLGVLALAALMMGSSGAYAAGNCTIKVDEQKEAQQLLNAAVDQEKANPEDVISQKINGIKWWVSKEGSDCPSEVTIQASLEFAIAHSNSICSFEADVTKIAFRGGDGTLPRFIVNNTLKSCSQGVQVTGK